jgi:hypothetical protein
MLRQTSQQPAARSSGACQLFLVYWHVCAACCIWIGLLIRRMSRGWVGRSLMCWCVVGYDDVRCEVGMICLESRFSI